MKVKLMFKRISEKSRKFTALVVAVVCVVTIILRAAFACNANRGVKDVFDKTAFAGNDNGRYIDYGNGVSIYQAMSDIQHSTYDLTPLTSKFLSESPRLDVTLKRDIEFYEGANTREKPILTLKRGMTLHFDFSRLGIAHFPSSFPTFERGWRFVNFRNEGMISLDGKDSETIRKQLGIDQKEYRKRHGGSDWMLTGFPAYVERSDLERLWRDISEQNEDLKLAVKEIDNPLYINGALLYEDGIYLSPDLMRDVWSAGDTVLAVLAAVCAVYLALTSVEKKHKK